MKYNRLTPYFLSCTIWDMTVKVKNGTITLPKNLRHNWRSADVVIKEYGNERIVLERITPAKKNQQLEAFKAAAGILKGNTPDPVAWQRKIRKEWERKLPRIHVHR